MLRRAVASLVALVLVAGPRLAATLHGKKANRADLKEGQEVKATHEATKASEGRQNRPKATEMPARGDRWVVRACAPVWARVPPATAEAVSQDERTRTEG